MCSVLQAQDTVVDEGTHVSSVLEAVQEAAIVTEEERTVARALLTAAV